MKKPEKYKIVLQEILKTKEFDKLEPFTDLSECSKFTDCERELLGMLFVMQGEEQFTKGDNKALESFKIANQIVPNNPLVLNRQASVLAKQEKNVFCLKLACKIFQTVVEIKPDYFDPWYGWGNALITLGGYTQQNSYLHKALDKFAEAGKLTDKVSSTKIGSLYYDQGLCWYLIGVLSGEPSDFINAVQRFQLAVKSGVNTCNFWNDYGNSLVEIALLINKSEHICEAIEMYWNAIKHTPSSSDGWMNLATALQLLYQNQPQETYFTLSDESFSQASK